VLEATDLAAHAYALSRREQRVLMLTFYGNMTQAQIAGKVGCSQMCVSRCRPARWTAC
jgi:DNA-directed RNA polymerase specialized sigma subunit